MSDDEIELDGTVWRSGDIATDANGDIYRLVDYAASSSFWKDHPAHQRWYWLAFGTEVDWPAFPESRSPDDPQPPFTKVWLTATRPETGS